MINYEKKTEYPMAQSPFPIVQLGHAELQGIQKDIVEDFSPWYVTREHSEMSIYIKVYIIIYI